MFELMKVHTWSADPASGAPPLLMSSLHKPRLAHVVIICLWASEKYCLVLKRPVTVGSHTRFSSSLSSYSLIVGMRFSIGALPQVEKVDSAKDVPSRRTISNLSAPTATRRVVSPRVCYGLYYLSANFLSRNLSFSTTRGSGNRDHERKLFEIYYCGV